MLFLRIMPHTAPIKPMCMAGSTTSQAQAARLPKKRSSASRRKRACQTVMVLVKGPFIRHVLLGNLHLVASDIQ